MVCIYCDSATQVINSRLQKRPNQVWRRRKCQKCGAVFTTIETTAYDAVWRVREQNGHLEHLEPFKPNKLLISLYKSLGHRPSSLDDAAALVDTLMAKLRLFSQNGVLEADDIAKTAYDVLKRFDTAAATSYQAFHPIKK